MRRVMALAGVAALTVTGAACAPEAPAATRAWSTPAAVTPARATAGATGVPVDRAMTRRACVVASGAADRGMEVFRTETARLERAAARSDQATMISAATAITRQFSSMAATLRSLSRQSVDPQVQAALVDAEGALTEMGSASYSGTLADQRAQLRDLAKAFDQACD